MGTTHPRHNIPKVLELHKQTRGGGDVREIGIETKRERKNGREPERDWEINVEGEREGETGGGKQR